jgi:uncharacterized protein (DUF885 family)
VSDYEQYRHQEFPIEATAAGDHRFNTRLGAISPADCDRRAGIEKAFLDRARVVPSEGLRERAFLTRTILVREIEHRAERTALSRHNLETEVDRYSAWPGQALAYKMGGLVFERLRSEAETQLGERFDRRAFHDMLLAEGAIPLDLLKQRARARIAAGKQAAP